MDRQVSRAELRAQEAERRIASRVTVKSTLKATIESAELYMQALRLSDSPTDRKRLDAKCKELISEAEQLKVVQDSGPKASHINCPVSTRKLTTRENIIILQGSKLNGFVFKPWTSVPNEDEFILGSDQTLFQDSAFLTLSVTHKESFGGWKRPRHAFKLLELRNDGQSLSTVPTMKRLNEKCDLVQDLTSDCSVVASLCAGAARAERGHSKISASFVYPYDHDHDQPKISANGKYIFRLYFNGSWRRVEIDDLLPTSTNQRVLHVVDRSNPGLLLPAILEKAYLKVRGGYDFPGSNSGTDLAVLTGWIPQQVFLHDHDVEPDSLWEELMEGFDSGDNLLTIGTGKLTRREQKHLGLAAEHDYAVLDMKERAGIREMLVKNPWADGDIWKGATRRKPHPNHDYPELPPVNDCDEMLPGTFWMDFQNVFHHYENLYINWNPAMFSHRADRHFSWTLSSQRSASSFVDDHPQFRIEAQADGQLWLLLNRHFRTGDYTHDNHGKKGYIGLYLLDGGQRVFQCDSANMKGPFVDSPNTLLRFEAHKGKQYTAVVVQQDLPVGKHNFTVSLFSKYPATIDEAPTKYTHRHKLSAAWTRTTAGGSSDSANYLTNPQFNIEVQSEQQIVLLLRVLDEEDNSRGKTEFHIKSLVAFSDGKRITRLRNRDIAAHSGDYHRGYAVVASTLGRGSYTVICSTFDENQLAKFSLESCSESEAVSISKLPAEDSGRLTIRAPPAIFSVGLNRLLVPLKVSKATKTIVIARQEQRLANASLFKLSLEEGQGPYRKVLANSSLDDEDFQVVSTGLRLDDMIFPTSEELRKSGGLWLVLERLAQHGDASGPTETLHVEFLAEDSLEIGDWGVGCG